MSAFGIGISALNASQRAIDVIGENIANANTPGYHRQQILFTERPPVVVGGLALGTGVQVSSVRQVRSQLIESAITQNIFVGQGVDAALASLRQIETELTPGGGSLDNLLAVFFNQLEELTARPDDTALRRVFLNTAAGVANRFNGISDSLSDQRSGIDAQIGQIVNDANSLITQIADLNEQIQTAEVGTVNANDLRDQRDQLINQLAELIDLRVLPGQSGQSTVIAANLPVVVANQVVHLQFKNDPNGNAVISPASSTNVLNITGGKLGGLLSVRNQTLPDLQARLDTLAQELVKRLDQVHAMGIGLTGPSTFLAGTRPATSTTRPLATAGLALPPQAGTLFISVTDLSTGSRTITPIAIDPATQSLADLAAAISAVPNLQGLADVQTGQLSILARPGFAFDFAGRLASAPESVTISGSTAVQISGAYTGTANDIWTFRAVTNPPGGSGTIGQTQGLTLEVRSSTGTVLGSFNIGQGYQPGTDLLVGDGVRIRLSPGTALDGDSFTVRVVGNPDTSGILTSLGLNTLFTGTNAGNLAVRQELRSHPELLAASRTGQPGDSSNLTRLIGLRDQLVLAGNTQTFNQFYSALVGEVGTGVRRLIQEQEASQAFGQQLFAQQQAVSGVDPNEELVQLLQFQRAFQLAARYLSLVDSTLDSLFQIVTNR